MSHCLREKSYILMQCNKLKRVHTRGSTGTKCVITLELKFEASAPRSADETYCCGQFCCSEDSRRSVGLIRYSGENTHLWNLQWSPLTEKITENHCVSRVPLSFKYLDFETVLVWRKCFSSALVLVWQKADMGIRLKTPPSSSDSLRFSPPDGLWFRVFPR